MTAASAVNQKLETIIKCQEEHDHFINGNGQPGAKVRLTVVENSIADIKSMLNKILATSLTILGGLIVWFITQLILKI